jgi:hypothetical protein
VVLEFEATKWPGTYLKLNTGKVARRGKEEAPGSVAESSDGVPENKKLEVDKSALGKK